MSEFFTAYHVPNNGKTASGCPAFPQRADKRGDLCRLRTRGDKLQAVLPQNESQKGGCKRMAAEVNALYEKVSPRTPRTASFSKQTHFYKPIFKLGPFLNFRQATHHDHMFCRLTRYTETTILRPFQKRLKVTR